MLSEKVNSHGKYDLKHISMPYLNWKNLKEINPEDWGWARRIGETTITSSLLLWTSQDKHKILMIFTTLDSRT